LSGQECSPDWFKVTGLDTRPDPPRADSDVSSALFAEFAGSDDGEGEWLADVRGLPGQDQAEPRAVSIMLAQARSAKSKRRAGFIPAITTIKRG